MFIENKDGTRAVSAELHDSSFVAERTINYIDKVRDREKPFFAVASFPDPHHPFNPPQDFAQRYTLGDAIRPTGGTEDLKTRPKHYLRHYRGGWQRSGYVEEKHPDGIPEEEERRRIINTYAMVDLIDYNVGRILEYLEQENLTDETIIVLSSDHGELMGDHGLWFKGPFFYEGLVNTPLIICDPDLESSFVSQNLISSIDILPTIYGLLGISIPPYVEGLSHAPHLYNGDCKIRDSCLIEYRNGYGDKDCASVVLVSEGMKYVRYQTGESELTDMIEDPEEKENVAGKAQYRKAVRKLSTELLTTIIGTQTKCPEQISHA